METLNNLRVEDLVAETEWLRGLARSLVRDEHEANDLVQSTWLAVLRRREAPNAPPRSWLGQVMRNLARENWRTARRREAREAARASVEEGAPSAGALVEQLELTTLVSQCVLGLEEPERSTVLLRYYGGSSSAQIARQLGIPAATVRARLKRGIDRIRGQLDERHGGNRRAWSLPLAAWAAPSRAVGVAVLLVLGVASLGVAGWLAFATPSASRASVRAPSSEIEPARTEGSDSRDGAWASVRGAPTESDHAKDSDEELEDSGRWRFRSRIVGRLLDRQGAPLEGVRLKTPHSDSDDEWVYSGRDGRFDWEDRFGCASVRSDRPGILGVNLEFVRADCERFERRVEAPEDGDIVELGDLVLLPGGTVAGVVADCASRPAVAARLDFVEAFVHDGSEREAMHAFISGALTDERGRFEWLGIPVGQWMLRARGEDGSWAVSEPFAVKGGERFDTFRLELSTPPFTLQLQAFGPTGEPFAYADLSARIVGSEFTTWEDLHLDSNGRGDLRSSCGEWFDMRASIPNECVGEIQLSAAELRTGQVELRFERAEPLELHVVSGERVVSICVAPAATALGRPSVDSPRGGVLLRSAPVQADGVLRIPSPQWPFEVFVTAPNRTVWRSGALAALGARPPLEVRFAPAPGLSGFVVNAGAPVADALVQTWADLDAFCDSCPPLGGDSSTRTTRTDADGGFHFEVRSAQRFQLIVEAQGLAPKVQSFDAIDPERGLAGAVIELTPGGALRGRACDENGAALPGHVIGVRDESQQVFRCARTSSDGEFEFTHLSAGPWDVRFLEREPDSFARFSWWADRSVFDAPSGPRAIVLEGGVTETILQRALPARLSGRLRVNGAAPVGRWRLRHAHWVLKHMHDDPSVASAVIDASGEFELVSCVFDGTAVELEGLGLTLELDLALTPGESVRRELELETGRIEGHVTRSRGVFDRLYLRGRCGSFLVNSPVRIAPGGAFEIASAPTGDLQLVWDHDAEPGEESGVTPVLVRVGATTRVVVP